MVRNPSSSSRPGQEAPKTAAAAAAHAAAAHVSRISGLPAKQLLASCPAVAPPVKPKHRAVVKGANNGKLAPGEKRRLNLESKAARRAAREAGRGFDVIALLKVIEEFVEREMDMTSLDPMGSYGAVSGW